MNLWFSAQSEELVITVLGWSCLVVGVLVHNIPTLPFEVTGVLVQTLFFMVRVIPVVRGNHPCYERASVLYSLSLSATTSDMFSRSSLSLVTYSKRLLSVCSSLFHSSSKILRELRIPLPNYSWNGRRIRWQHEACHDRPSTASVRERPTQIYTLVPFTACYSVCQWTS